MMRFFYASPLLLVATASARADSIPGILRYSLLGGQEPATNQTLVKRADGQAVTGWDSAVHRGTRLWKKLSDGQYFDKEARTLHEDNWKVEEIKNSMITDDLKLLLQKVAQFEGYPNVRARATHRGGAPEGREIPKGWQSKFSNVFCPDHKIIIADNNKKATKAQRPPQNFWSDVVFAGWKIECERRGFPVSGLQQIIRSDITNTFTREIISKAYRKFEPRTSVVDPVTWWPSERTKEAFLALLGSPNGSGVARLLLEHEKAFGRKIILSVETWTIVAPGDREILPFTYQGLVWNIGDASPPATAGGQTTHVGGSPGPETPAARKRKHSEGTDRAGFSPVHRAGKKQGSQSPLLHHRSPAEVSEQPQRRFLNRLWYPRRGRR
jgi:hypothetical protein